jgi:oligopeptide transport system permease protein
MNRASGRFRKNRVAVASACFLFAISLMSVCAPWVTRFSFDEINIAEKLLGPSSLHWMGTDTLGRDLYSRVVYGGRMSLAVGICTAVFGLVLGTIVGAVAGYWGGWTDRLLMRIVDVFYIFPSILLAILLGLLFGRGFLGILLAIGITSWVTQARLVRGQVLQAKAMPYVESARALGASSIPILARHILPNILGPIIVSLTLQIPANIMAESFLSFLGLGLQPPFSSWGTLANDGFRAMKSYPHLIIYPGGVLFLTMLAFNYFGDGLRDFLDPRSGESSLQ